jgi:hypothetical protein
MLPLETVLSCRCDFEARRRRVLKVAEGAALLVGEPTVVWARLSSFRTRKKASDEVEKRKKENRRR